MSKFGSNLKTISFVLVQALLFEQFAFAGPELFQPTKLALSQKPHVALNLPESEAVIEDAYKAGESTIYLIQDAHTNDSGQINLAKTLDRIFSQEKDIRYIFTEGAVADNSLSELRTSKPLSERQAVGMSYISKGLLHGIVIGRQVEVFGAVKKALPYIRHADGLALGKRLRGAQFRQGVVGDGAFGEDIADVFFLGEDAVERLREVDLPGVVRVGILDQINRALARLVGIFNDGFGFGEIQRNVRFLGERKLCRLEKFRTRKSKLLEKQGLD
jgi:hypothetical protein